MTSYVLGNTASEIARLELQQEVWGGVTERFFDRLGVSTGARCLDMGAGIGVVSMALRKRVGDDGRVVAVEPARHWAEHIEREARSRGYRNVEAIVGTIDDASVPPGAFDLVFSRWVLSFLPDVRGAIARLATYVAPGGVLAIQDYNHEGVSAFPDGEGFRAAIRATRATYAMGGGDVWVAAKLPAAMRDAGLEIVDLTPNVLAGAPGSPAFRWADAFFPTFVERFAEQGLMTAGERDSFREEWAARIADPNALFFSPIVVDIAGRRPTDPKQG